MRELLEAVAHQLQEKWISIATASAFMVVGWYFGKRRARSDWKKKEFYDRLNVSLTAVRDGKLYIRTIIEKTCSEFFLNTIAVETVLAQARKTTEKDSLLPLPAGDYWYYLNAILNEISEKFALGQIRRDLGMPVTSEIYLICLTAESAGDMRTRKIRAMLVQRKLLEKLPEAEPLFDRPHHATRWRTLQQLAAEYARTKDRFLEIEIAV